MVGAGTTLYLYRTSCQSELSVLTQFLSNRSQNVVVDGCWSKPVNVVWRVPHGSCLGPQHHLFLYTSELYSMLEYTLLIMLTTPLW